MSFEVIINSAGTMRHDSIDYMNHTLKEKYGIENGISDYIHQNTEKDKFNQWCIEWELFKDNGNNFLLIDDSKDWTHNRTIHIPTCNKKSKFSTLSEDNQDIEDTELEKLQDWLKEWNEQTNISSNRISTDEFIHQKTSIN